MNGRKIACDPASANVAQMQRHPAGGSNAMRRMQAQTDPSAGGVFFGRPRRRLPGFGGSAPFALAASVLASDFARPPRRPSDCAGLFIPRLNLEVAINRVQADDRKPSMRPLVGSGVGVADADERSGVRDAAHQIVRVTAFKKSSCRSDSCAGDESGLGG